MANLEIKAVMQALTAESSPADDDYLLIYDASVQNVRKIRRDDFLDGIGGIEWGAIGGLLSDQTDLQAALDAKAPIARTVSSGVGLSGGGNLSANRTLALDINGLTEETSAASGDFIAIYDLSAGAIRKMTRANFLAGLGGASSPMTLTANSPTETALTLKNASGQSVQILRVLNSIDTELLTLAGEGYGTAYLNVHGRVQLTAGSDSAFTIGDASFSGYGGTIIGYNGAESVIFRDNSANDRFKLDNNHSANQTGLLLFADGSLKRVKLDTASGGKRTLYVDA